MELPSLPQHRGCLAHSRRALGDVACFHPAPKAWEASESGRTDPVEYSVADIATWRAEFGFARRQHSLAQFGYTDDELCEWRKPFDALATEQGIGFEAFEGYVTKKFRGSIPDDKLKEKLQSFWQQFDGDANNHIHFGEFIVASFLLDVMWSKERIRNQGIEDTFLNYAVEDFMAEPHLFDLMVDFKFFVSTATDVHKLMLVADQDRDGLVSLADFTQWASSEDDGLEDLNEARKGKRRRSPQRTAGPPPIPDDDE